MASASYCPVCLTTFREQPERCPNLACGARRPDAGWGRLLEPGDLLDRHYRIERALAVGGAGLTYLAREVDAAGAPTGPELAIKVLYHARATGSFLTRLSTEAQVLQELDHPHIIQLRGFVHRAGTEPYLVTLFERGGTLAQHSQRVGPLPARVAAAILVQVLGALDVAHQRGVVHRDLKPDNVLLEAQVEAETVPHVRVADFGIAKVAGSLTSAVTKIGSFLGTPEYAAPEQFDGGPPTPAADVFAAGALLLHLLTGQAPVQFSDRTDIGSCRREWLAALPPRLEPSRLRDADPVTAAVLEEVLRHMLAVRPEQRWTVAQVRQRLRGVAEGQVELQPVRETVELTAAPPPRRSTAAPEPPPTAPASSGMGAAVAGLGVLGVLGLAALTVVVLAGVLGAAFSWGWFEHDEPVVIGAPPPQPDPTPRPDTTPQADPTPPDPTPPGPTPPPDTTPPPTDAAALAALPLLAIDDPARLEAAAQLQARAGALRSCGASGPALLTLWIVDGVVQAARADVGGEIGAAACLTERVRGEQVGGHGVARVGVHL